MYYNVSIVPTPATLQMCSTPAGCNSALLLQHCDGALHLLNCLHVLHLLIIPFVVKNIFNYIIAYKIKQINF